MAVPQHIHQTPPWIRHANEDRGTRVPAGRCNYTPLSAGGNAPVCGCRRFFDKARAGLGEGSGLAGLCMCEHHACFHDEAAEGQVSREVVTSERSPRITTMQNTPLLPTLQNPVKAAFVGPEQAPDRGPEMSLQPQDADLPETLQWNRFVQSGSNFSLPAIPSQCLLPSETASTSSMSQAAYSRPFGGLGLGTLNHIPTPNTTTTNTGRNLPQAQDRRMQVYKDFNGNECLQSVTEVATPSVQTGASQDAGAEIEFSKHVASVQNSLQRLVDGRPKTSCSLRRVAKDGMSQIPILKQSQSHLQLGADSLPSTAELENKELSPRVTYIVGQLADVPNKIDNHEQRLGLLENASFCDAGLHDLRQTDEHLDTRIGELEERMTEVERVQAANDIVSVSSRHVGDGSFTSRASISSSALIASAIDRIEESRIAALEAQVAELQASALPTYSRPWEVEVVFLPYGAELMGIWSPQHGMSQRSRLNSAATDDWTQTQHSVALAQACLAARDQTSSWERSAEFGVRDGQTWLMAKACGLRSRVDERLRSRGLVKTIQIFGADARDVQAAMMTAFGDLPSTLVEDPYTLRDNENAGNVPKALKQYLGLSAAWIPLRKLHKDTCLRFLSAPEMVTPALWTVPFLSSSVVMKHTGLRRLYVTQRDSYIQHLGRNNAGWTWQKLRQLPRVYPYARSFSHTPEGDAQEPCWEFDERLDPPQESTHSSFASHISSFSVLSLSIDRAQDDQGQEARSPSDHFSSQPASPIASTAPISVVVPGRPISPLRERNPFQIRPVRARTTSMPTLVPFRSSTPSTKRRITSFEPEQETVSSPTLTRAPSNSITNTPIATSILQINTKRRRISRSPSRPRDTPRWSDGPPSPYVSMEEAVALKRDERERMTPFAYATPHSNAPYVERPRSRASVNVYEDEDADFEPGNDQDSLTDEFDRDDDAVDESGYEGIALTDYSENEGESAQERQVDSEWEGVREEAIEVWNDYETTKPLNKSFSKPAEPDVDQASEVGSEAPSEYPSRQPIPVRGGTPERPPRMVGLGVFETTPQKPGFRIHVDDEGDELGV